MSVELEVGLGEPLGVSDLLEGLQSVLEPLGAPELRWDGQDEWLRVGTHGSLTADGAEIELAALALALDATGAEPPAAWLTVTVTLRTAESLLLAVATAGVLADAWGTTVVDDAGLLGDPSERTPAEVLRRVGELRGPSFRETAEAFARALGIGFPTARPADGPT